MKEVSKKTYTKTVTTYQVHEEASEVTLEVTRENGRVKKASLLGTPGETHLKTCRPAVAKPDLWQGIETLNPWWEVKGKYLISNAFEDPKNLLKIDVNPADLVWVYSAGHLMFDHTLKPIPMPIVYDYIGSPFSNRHSDLEAMLEHLKEHPWVLNRDELYIDDVPYYNNESGKERYIRGKELPWVVIKPDAEAWNVIYEMSLLRRFDFFSVEMKELLVGGPTYDPVKDFDPLDIHQFRLKKEPSWA